MKKQIWIVRIQNIDDPDRQNTRNYFTTYKKARAFAQKKIERGSANNVWSKRGRLDLWHCETGNGCVVIKIISAELE